MKLIFTDEKSERIKRLLKNSSEVLSENRKDNSYPFACGVMQSLIQQICDEHGVKTKKFFTSLDEHLKTAKKDY